MQKVVNVRDLNHVPLAGGNELVLEVLNDFAEQGLKRLYPAWGSATPPDAATVSNSTRLILSIDGRNKMAFPQGDRIITKTLLRGDMCFIDRLAWNKPLHVFAKCFLCIDIKSDRIRYYLRRTKAAGATPAQACLSWVNRAPDACTRHVVAACEYLLPQQEQQDLLHQLSTSLILNCMNELGNPDAQSHGGQTWLHVCDWIDDHLHEDIDRNSVAAARGIHPNHLSRLFRKHAGQRFVEYLCEQRIKRAKLLLEKGKFSVAEVARRCGYRSSEYFNTVFKRQTACTPGRWAKP